MKNTIRVGKIIIISFLKHILIVNAVLSVLYCIVRVIAMWDLLFDPPNIMVGSSSVNSSPLPYIIMPLVFIVLGVFIALTIIEIVVLSIYNLIAHHTGGIEVNIQIKNEDKKDQL